MQMCSSLTAASANVKNVLQIGKACMEGYENKLHQGFYNKISSYVVIRDAPMKGSNTAQSQLLTLESYSQNTWHYRFRRV